jgi:hypothetical protein
VRSLESQAPRSALTAIARALRALRRLAGHGTRFLMVAGSLTAAALALAGGAAAVIGASGASSAAMLLAFAAASVAVVGGLLSSPRATGTEPFQPALSPNLNPDNTVEASR